MTLSNAEHVYKSPDVHLMHFNMLFRYFADNIPAGKKLIGAQMPLKVKHTAVKLKNERANKAELHRASSRIKR